MTLSPLAIAGWLLRFLLVALVVVPARAADAPPGPAVDATRIEAFVREGCPHCAKAEEFLAQLQQGAARAVDRDPRRAEGAGGARSAEGTRTADQHRHGARARDPRSRSVDRRLLARSEHGRADPRCAGRPARRGAGRRGRRPATPRSRSPARKGRTPPTKEFAITLFGRTDHARRRRPARVHRDDGPARRLQSLFDVGAAADDLAARAAERPQAHGRHRRHLRARRRASPTSSSWRPG